MSQCFLQDEGELDTLLRHQHAVRQQHPDAFLVMYRNVDANAVIYQSKSFCRDRVVTNLFSQHSNCDLVISKLHSTDSDDDSYWKDWVSFVQHEGKISRSEVCKALGKQTIDPIACAYIKGFPAQKFWFCSGKLLVFVPDLTKDLSPDKLIMVLSVKVFVSILPYPKVNGFLLLGAEINSSGQKSIVQHYVDAI